VLTDQNAAQTWASTVSHNATFTLMIEFAGNEEHQRHRDLQRRDAVPALYQVFPGAASSGWFAVASFLSGPTRVSVNLFDQNAVLGAATRTSAPTRPISDITSSRIQACALQPG
jgi:hypothetical protein